MDFRAVVSIVMYAVRCTLFVFHHNVINFDDGILSMKCVKGLYFTDISSERSARRYVMNGYDTYLEDFESLTIILIIMNYNLGAISISPI